MSISVDKHKCKDVGLVLKALQIRSEFYNREFLTFDANRETKLRVYLFSAAICHQTHHLFHPELSLWGWEYMEFGFRKMVNGNSPLLNPEFLVSSEKGKIGDTLKRVFSASDKAEDSSLDRIPERSEMLNELAYDVVQNYHGLLSEFLDSSKGYLLNEDHGLYDLLGKFKAFSDPQKKKITFFLKLAADAQVFEIQDKQHIIPIMDYHMQRVLLRMGCVTITDQNLYDKLIHKIPLNSDEPIRGHCIEALKIITEYSGCDILKMNDFFWPLGRSCCNETTLCHDHVCLKSPCTFFKMVELPDHRHCVFETVCNGFSDEVSRKLWEPIVDTHFY